MRHTKYSFDSTFSCKSSSRPLRPGATDYEHIASKDSSGKIENGRVERLYYTGTELVGIATMHKSNAVPITRGSDMAVATAKMRRG